MSRFIFKRLAQLVVLSAGLLSMGTYVTVSAHSCPPDTTTCNTTEGTYCCSPNYECCPNNGGYCTYQGTCGSDCGQDETPCSTTEGEVCCSSGYMCCTSGGGYCSLDCG